MSKIKKIIIHCSATREGAYYNESHIRDWHKKRGFRTTGYHFIILLDGTIQVGRGVDNDLYLDSEEQGAHALGLNNESIGICYIGGLDKHGKSKDTRTLAQEDSMRFLVNGLKSQFGATVHGHNEFANKACPCFDVQKEFN